MKVIFNNFLIETDEIQAISPLDEVFFSFQIWLLNKENPIQIFISKGKEYKSHNEFENYEDYITYCNNRNNSYKIAYENLTLIWKTKLEKFHKII